MKMRSTGIAEVDWQYRYMNVWEKLANGGKK